MIQNLVDGQNFDVIVVGGGPSGSSCSIYLAKAGLNVLLVDRAKFPRDKICGDGISGKSMKVLQELDLVKDLETVEHLKMFGVTFSSPNGTVVEIPSKPKDGGAPPGFVARREVFDNVIFQNAKKLVTTIEGFQVNDLLWEETEDGKKQVVGLTGFDMSTRTKYSFRAKVIVGADGAASVVGNKTGLDVVDENHQLVAIRAYYENVGGMSDKIELHFVDSLMPGYFWIFPLPNGRANVGSGMITKDMKDKKVNLQQETFKIIETNPLFKDRFVNAKKLTEFRSWSLPVGSTHRKCYGNGFVLVGDAASLIDPFTGEGIGNALMSGKIAAQYILKAFASNDFSEEMFKQYDQALWEEVGDELKTSYRLQKIGKFKPLLNFIIDKAARNQKVREAISNSLLDPQSQKQFYSPLFYIKMLLS